MINKNNFFISDKLSINDFYKIHSFLFEDFQGTKIYEGHKAGEFKSKNNYISGGFKPFDHLIVKSEIQFLIEEFNKKPKNIYEAFQRASYNNLLFEMVHPNKELLFYR